MKVFVSGGSGFTGRRVVAAMIERGHEVSALARSSRSADVLAALGARPIDGDLDTPGSLRIALEATRPEVFCKVSSLGFGHADDVVAAVEAAGVPHAVYTSTTAIFTKLNAPSKKIRVAAEQSIGQASTPATIVRPTMIYGDVGDRNMERLIGLIRRSPVVPIPGRGDTLQQPVHVDDLARTIANAVERGTSGAFDVAGPEAIDFRSIVESSISAWGARRVVAPIPLGLVRTIVGRGEGLPRFPVSLEQIDRIEEDKVFEIGAAIAELDHRPRPFDDGVQQLCTAIRQADT